MIDIPLAGRNGICVRTTVARTLLERTRGLLARPSPAPGHALMLRRCSAVHTIGMSYPIDVVFLDRDLRVLRVDGAVKPGRFAIRCRGAAHVLEMGAGQAAASGLKAGTEFRKPGSNASL